MYRSHTCGELRASHINTEVTLSWLGSKSEETEVIYDSGLIIRDRYGITQLMFNEDRTSKDLIEEASKNLR